MARYGATPARLIVDVDEDEVDVVSGDLWALGTIGIEETRGPDGTVRLLAGFERATDADAAAGRLGRFAVVEELNDPEALLDTWREHATAVRAGHRIVVKPPWVPYETAPVDLVLAIDPGRTFGSGSHVSTRLALAEMERLLEGNERVLDVGCGSGVLSVAAARLGAVEVIAIDIDPAVVDIVHRNARRNGVPDTIEVSTTPLAEVEGSFDLIVANMLASVLREVGPDLVGRLAPRGMLILSGLLEQQLDDVAAAVVPLRLQGTTAEDGWCCATFTW